MDNRDSASAVRGENTVDGSLAGKRVIFLGSSVTFGAAAGGRSFAELLAEKDGIIALKEAVSGTTLTDVGESSYVARLKRIDKNFKADAFVCQLSTNDASLRLPLGKADAAAAKECVPATVAGAIGYIISYVREIWKCPIVFYTGTRYDSPEYARMVELLIEIAELKNIGVIDLWHSDMNDIPADIYKKYMADPIHPTALGYKEWWLPQFENGLKKIFCTNN